MILHVDADAFFASVEQAADPRLRGRAIAVGGERRGVVASASYEARRLGIYTPMPTVKAKKLCPSLIVLPGDFEKYERFSRLMFSYAYDLTPTVEQASIDECYLDLQGTRQIRPHEAGEKMQRAIFQSLKLSVSVGLGSNKLVSQIASKLRKPYCFIEVAPGHEQGFLWPLENRWLPSVGPHLGERLDTAGLRRVEHIAKTPISELALLAGSAAEALHGYALGHDPRPVLADEPAAKSYGEQETFDQDTTDETFILARLRMMADSLLRKVRAEKKSIRTVTLRLRYNDMAEVSRSQSLDEPTDLEQDIYPQLSSLLKKAWERRVSVRLIGLRFSKIYEATFTSFLALETLDMKREKLLKLTQVVDDLRREQRSIMRGHEFWLVQRGNTPRQQLPQPRLETKKHNESPHRVLKERQITPPQQQPTQTQSPSEPKPTHSHPPPAQGRPSHTFYQKAPCGLTSLNVKSCYSFLDSTLTLPKLVETAVETGVKNIALMDPHLHAAVPFFQAAQAAGLRPILGAELRCGGTPLLAYVQDNQGYAHLCHLLSRPQLSLADLHEHQEGLLFLPAAHAPAVRYRDASEHSFFQVLQSMKTLTLLHQSHPEKRKGDFSWQHGLVHPGTSWKNHPIPQPHHPDPTHFQQLQQVITSWAHSPEQICEQATFTFDFHTLRFPRYVPRDGSTPAEMLSQLAFTGLRHRYGSRATQHTAQLREELSIISEVGYEEYFLTVWQLLQDCTQRGIQWITRGSAADSLVCYCLGISQVCPIRFELYFKRFLNRDRMALQKLPDIDLDFAHDRKDEVVQLLLQRYGPDHAAIVGGFQTFQARSAFADIAKVLGVAEGEIRSLTRHLPWTDASHAADAVARSRECTLDDTWKEEPQRTALLMAGMLDSFPRYAKMHPCGVVLSRDPIHSLTPTFISAKGWPTTHFDMDAVEAVGLIKLDILAQGGLAVLRDTRLSLQSSDQKSFDLQALEVGLPGGTETPQRPPDAASWTDPAVWELIATGQARGVHHIESPAMTSLACMANVRDIDRLVAIVSVIRPGAANGLKKAQFARRAQGLEPIEHAHPSLEKILHTTFGVVAYEEHILQICETFAGMNAGRADVLRRALVKQDSQKIQALQAEFITAARALGRDEPSITKVWELIIGFQGYAFCRAHSTAYAIEAYQGAYAKCHHPAEFMASILTHGKGFYTPLLYTLECRRLGLSFLHPCVRNSTDSFHVQSGTSIRIPLRAILGISHSTLHRWQTATASQPFTSLRDFYHRVRPEASELLLLIRVGALDTFGLSRTELFWQTLHLAAELGYPESLLLQPTEGKITTPASIREEPSSLQKLQDEMQLLGYTVSAHPLDLYPDILWGSYCPISDLHLYMDQTVTICGLIVVSRSHMQQDGNPMKFISIADRTGIVECEMFAACYRAFGLTTVRYPVVQVTATVKPFDNYQGFTLQIQHVAPPRSTNPTPQ